MQLAITAAEFTAGHGGWVAPRPWARSAATARLESYEAMMVEGMVRRGYEREFAERCFKQIKGFGSYGFPESHAASFAKLVYVSAFLKCRYPAVFAAALLNSQPMGFYAPAQIVRDAREHDVEVRPVDVEHSAWDCTLEGDGPDGPALRLGFRQIDGFSEAWAKKLIDGRGAGFKAFDALVRRRRPHPGAAAATGRRRRHALPRPRPAQALWRVRGVPKAPPAPLLRDLPDDEAMVDLPKLGLAQHVLADYQTTRLSLEGASGEFLPASLYCRRHFGLRRSRPPERQGQGGGGGRGAGAPAAGHRQGLLHHPRGRDRGGQPGGHAAGVRDLSPGDHERTAGGGAWAASRRARRGSCICRPTALWTAPAS